jgi:hypothetical protein
MDTSKAQEAPRIARELAQQAKSVTDLHNPFFGIGGKLPELFPTRAEREAFAKMPEYRKIVGLRAAFPHGELAALGFGAPRFIARQRRDRLEEDQAVPAVALGADGAGVILVDQLAPPLVRPPIPPPKSRCPHARAVPGG